MQTRLISCRILRPISVQRKRPKVIVSASTACINSAFLHQTSSSMLTKNNQYEGSSLSAKSFGLSPTTSSRPTSSSSGLHNRDMTVNCTCLDSEGNVTTVSGDFNKLELCDRHGLQPRDLRKVDSRVPNVVPTILVRPGSILINMLHIRSLITKDSVWLFASPETAESSLLYSSFVYNLQGNLRLGTNASGGQPYEFRALEAALTSVCYALESELSNVHVIVEKLLGELEHRIEADKLKILLQYSRKLSAFEKRARLVQAAIDEVLEQNDDLDAMYLTDSTRKPNDHNEVEILLESFSKQIEEIVNEVEHVISNIHQTQEIIELILDSSRNSLLALDLQVSIGTMGLTTGSMIAALFGMNLTSGLESHPQAFWWTASICGALALTLSTVALRRLREIRRVSLASGAVISRSGALAGGISSISPASSTSLKHLNKHRHYNHHQNQHRHLHPHRQHPSDDNTANNKFWAKLSLFNR